MESIMETLVREGGKSVWTCDTPRRLNGGTLRVGDIMSKDVVIANPDDTIFSVAQQMSQQSLSCVVVVGTDGRVVGILSAKDMMNSVARRDADFRQLRVSERMSSPVDTISSEASVLEADRMMQVNCIRRLPVVQGERLVGIVTQTDITRALISLNSLGRVSDIMSQSVATIPAAATAVEAARQMSEAGISCLVVTHEGKIAGILTERDLLKRIVALQKDPSEIRVREVMSLPVVTVPPSCSILDAGRKMETQHFHRLLVTEGMTIYGLVTQTDIMRAVRRAAEAVEAQQCTLNMELAELVQRAIWDLQRVRNFLEGIPPVSARDHLPTESAPPAPQSN